ncbi:hypothetical protein Scep_024108 [Stephania cephalantha]|uniref:Uncharacterized protein n=1 Tax=Stephania cephalantha TaxID=152367 RepID=A0AAP0HTE2_9MAGN
MHSSVLKLHLLNDSTNKESVVTNHRGSLKITVTQINPKINKHREKNEHTK